VLALPSVSGAAKHPRLSAYLPDPGHVTLQAVELKVTGKPARALPRHVRLGFVKRGSLPPSVRVLTATRAFGRSKATVYAALVIVVNKAGAAGARAANDESEEPTLLDMILDRRRTPCRHCHQSLTPLEYERKGGMCNCYVRVKRLRQAAAVNADAATSSRQLGTLTDLFKGDFTEAGDPKPVFNEPSLDTGHYDDGHAFGWNVKKEPEIIKVEIDLVQDLIDGQQQNIVPDLELAGGVDLNGNAQIDQPGSGQQVTTIIGPPTIT
jgi:hypothetical protein